MAVQPELPASHCRDCIVKYYFFIFKEKSFDYSKSFRQIRLMSNISNQTFSALTAACILTPHAFAHTGHFDQPASVHIRSDEEHFTFEAAWSNRYLSEGREAFGNNGLLAFLATASYDPFSIELWSGFSDASAEREFEAALLYSIPLIPWSPTLGIAHVNDFRGTTEEWDFSLGLEGELAYGVEAQAEIVYGIDSNGFYIETGIARPFEMDRMAITPSAHMGHNFGYVADGHNGPDHFALQLQVSREITESSILSATLSHYTPIQKNSAKYADDDDLYRGLHFTISLGIAF